MIEQLDKQTRERINKAIGNIRLLATRVKRASILDATQRAEIVVTLLNDFRQHVNAVVAGDQAAIRNMPFRYNADTLTRVVQAALQADTIYSFMTIARKKTHQEEYRQVWKLLENIHTYVETVIKKGEANAKS